MDAEHFARPAVEAEGERLRLLRIIALHTDEFSAKRRRLQKTVCSLEVTARTSDLSLMMIAVNAPWLPKARAFVEARFRCRLCWAVTLGVFLGIVVIEGIILVPSYFSYRDDQLERIETAGLTAVRSFFSLAGRHAHPGDLPEGVAALIRNTVLKGAAIYHADGKLAGEFGENPGPVEDGRMDVVWTPEVVKAPYRVVGRLDVNEAVAASTAFVWRIVGLVVLIATFLTLTTMAFLNRLVLTPILLLRRRLEAAGEDPAHPDRHVLPGDRADELGSVFTAFNGMIRRIAEANIALRQSAEEEIRSLARFPDENANPVLRVDGNAVVLYANAASAPLLAAWDAAVGRALPDDLPACMQDALKSGSEMELEVTATDKRLFAVRFSPVREAGYVNAYGSDITERKRFEEELMRLANYDELTGLPNRSLLQDRLKLAVAGAHRDGSLIAVMNVGLDRFKRINETLGHDAGDALIRKVSAALPRCLPETATAARYGGDVFTVILSGVDEATAAADIAQRILDCFARPMTVDGNSVDLSASIGISLYPLGDSPPERLVDNAEVAMFRAKASDGNSFRFHESGMDAAVEERRVLLRDLRHAADLGQLDVHYQPQVDLGSGLLIGMEALLRWQHPQMGPISPGTFIPLAEESRFIVPIGLWVLRTACAQNKAWQDAGLPPLKVAVNLSAVQFTAPDLVDQVQDALGVTGLDPRFLELEITESVAMHDADATIATMEALRGLGVSLSIDDFGTGYSSLGYLRRFPTEKVKVDQSFVRGLDGDPNLAAICNGVIRMSHGLDMKVLAEGVETEGELALLGELGCDAVQGYYFSRPLDATAFAKAIAERGLQWTTGHSHSTGGANM